MTLEARKISFIQEFLTIQNEDVVLGLENFLRKKQVESYGENFEPKSTAIYEKEIEEAIDDSNHARIIKASDLKAKINQWG